FGPTTCSNRSDGNPCYTFRLYLTLDAPFGAELPRKANVFRNSRIRILLWSLALRCRSKRERFPFLRDMQSPLVLSFEPDLRRRTVATTNVTQDVSDSFLEGIRPQRRRRSRNESRN